MSSGYKGPMGWERKLPDLTLPTRNSNVRSAHRRRNTFRQTSVRDPLEFDRKTRKIWKVWSEVDCSTALSNLFAAK